MHVVAWLERGKFGLCSAVHAVKHRKNVHGARLGGRLAKQPQQLVLIPSRRRDCALHREPRRVVQPELEPTRPAGPRTDLITHREQWDPTLPTRGIAAAAAIAGAADVGSRGEEEDVERCVAGRRDAQ